MLFVTQWINCSDEQSKTKTKTLIDFNSLGFDLGIAYFSLVHVFAQLFLALVLVLLI